MAVSPCLPSVTSSTLIERFSQVEPKATTNHCEKLNNLQLSEHLAGFLIRRASNAVDQVADNVDSQPKESGTTNENPVPHPISTPHNSSNTDLSLLQAQQLALLLSTLACRANSSPNLSTVPTAAAAVSVANHSAVGSSNPQTAIASPDQTVHSSNILQQLLCGADVNQLRNRSGLIESNPSETNGSNSIPNGASQVPSQNHTPHIHESNPVHHTMNNSIAIPTILSPAAQWANHILHLPIPVLNSGAVSTPLSQISSAILPADQLLSILCELSKLNHAQDTSHLLTSNVSDPGVRVFVNVPLNSVVSPPFTSTNGLPTTTPSSTQASNFSPTHFKSNSPGGSISGSNTFDTVVSQGRGMGQSNSKPSADFRTGRTRFRSRSDFHSGMTVRRNFHRPRSYSKNEQLLKSSVSVNVPDKLSKELESSLFAQLVLSPDTPSPKEPVENTMESRVQGPKTLKIERRPSSNSSAASFPNGDTNLYCSFHVRDRIFEWLREADLFVAEHCCDIPLGALLAAAITPSRSGLAELCATFVTSSCSEPVSTTAKRAVSKCWYQLLLISLMQNDFIPTPSTGVSPAHADQTAASTDRSSNPLQDKLKKAIATLAALETEDSPPPDRFLINELTGLVKSAAELKLDTSVYKSMRFCVLAQCAYPLHFSTSFTEALSALQTQIDERHSDQSQLTEVLKLLNRLHCFDPGTLKQFFCLASDNLTETIPLNSDPDLFPASKTVVTHAESTSSCKRKASQSSLNRLVLEREASPIPTRSRAYTTNSFNKSARMSKPGINL